MQKNLACLSCGLPEASGDQPIKNEGSQSLNYGNHCLAISDSGRIRDNLAQSKKSEGYVTIFFGKQQQMCNYKKVKT